MQDMQTGKPTRCKGRASDSWIALIIGDGGRRFHYAAGARLDLSFLSSTGTSASKPRSANAISVSFETRPDSESMVPSVSPRLANTKLPGMIPIAVASTYVDTLMVVN